jgi:hypothetical protein
MPERTIQDHREGRLQWSGGSRKGDSIKIGDILLDCSSEEGGARVPELHDGLGDVDVKAMLGGGAEDREEVVGEGWDMEDTIKDNWSGGLALEDRLEPDRANASRVDNLAISKANRHHIGLVVTNPGAMGSHVGGGASVSVP